MILYFVSYAEFNKFIRVQLPALFKDKMAFQLKIQNVLISDNLDDCCKEIFSENGINVKVETKLTKEELLKEIPVSLTWPNGFTISIYFTISLVFTVFSLIFFIHEFSLKIDDEIEMMPFSFHRYLIYFRAMML